MIKSSYKYRPPLTHLGSGILFTLGGVFFGFFTYASLDELWLAIVMFFFCILLLTFGIGLITIFIRKFSVGNIEIDEQSITIPGRWKEKTKLLMEEIYDVGEFETYDEVIEVLSEKGTFLIEKKWMREDDFYELKSKFRQVYLNTDSNEKQ